jgi:hypothetical protein
MIEPKKEGNTKFSSSYKFFEEKIFSELTIILQKIAASS